MKSLILILEILVEKVLDIIPTRPLQAKDSVAFEGFTTPFVTLDYFEVHDRYYNPVWVRNNLQNINITYNGIADGAEFAMLVRGVVDNYVELELLAKAKTIGAVKTTKLLTNKGLLYIIALAIKVLDV